MVILLKSMIFTDKRMTALRQVVYGIPEEFTWVQEPVVNQTTHYINLTSPVVFGRGLSLFNCA